MIYLKEIFKEKISTSTWGLLLESHLVARVGKIWKILITAEIGLHPKISDVYSQESGHKGAKIRETVRKRYSFSEFRLIVPDIPVRYLRYFGKTIVNFTKLLQFLNTV